MRDRRKEEAQQRAGQKQFERDYKRDRRKEELGWKGRLLNYLTETWLPGFHLAKNPPKGAKKTKQED